MVTSGEIPLPRRVIGIYALGSMGTGGFSTLPGLVLIYYMTDTLGIAALGAGLLLGVAKIWDVLIDPVIGIRSDRDLAATGSRHRFMVVGGTLLPLFFILTFAVPAGLGQLVAGLWVLVAFTATATAFSLFQVPYMALPAELTASYDQRTRLLSLRVLVLSLAILLFGAGGPALRTLGGENQWLGYFLMSVVAGIVIGASLLASARVAPSGGTRATVQRAPIRQGNLLGLAVLRRSQPFRALLLAFALQGLATGGMLAGAQYVATWVLHDEEAVTFLFIALIGPALLFAPIWRMVARRIGKERSFLLSSILFGLAALALAGMLLRPGTWVYLPVALAGAGYAGMQSLPMSMLPDVITHDALEHGQGNAGIFGGVWTAGETTGMALGAVILTVVLAASGYAESVAGQATTQQPSAITGIILAFSVLPALVIALSLWAFGRYPLRESNFNQPHGAAAA
ncbi:MFS transporter [Paeniglutamicibacter psychrophenolicus]|uniref:MFS transporter n=1 Tax=Paeniglutamicibacter psychrophenolicus TaxID=257454 RepID=UPI00277F9DF9|nr:MFS transporter [Paeniglutamicibacter psychrophenolicus]MDQ0094549.1 Na+/melibiose symporter-like transporter [Paeniglutamicibacter psychrophenolicus]